jgi:hypothetical protein
MIGKLMLEHNFAVFELQIYQTLLFPWQPWTLFKFSLLSVFELAFSYKISNMEIFDQKKILK